MSSRAQFWYIFGLAAITLIALLVRSARRADYRDPMALSFIFCLFLPAFGTLSKQPPLAALVDAGFGPNAAWLLADILFISGVCVGTYWIDMLGRPELRALGWRLLLRWRVAALLATAAWMILAALLEAPVWAGLERGGIDVGGRPLLLSGRMAYFAYSLWSLIYLSLGFYRRRQHMRDRTFYIRLGLPWAAITLAIAAPVLQVIGTIQGFIWPHQIPVIWPTVWRMVTLVQVGVAILMLTTFFAPAYQAIIWLDKQLLVHRLLRIRRTIHHSRPDLMPDEEPALGRPGLIVAQPDLWLTALVSEIELVKTVMGQSDDQVEVPAGMIMPQPVRHKLQHERDQFLRGLDHRPATAPQASGDFYALAHWYAVAL